MGAILESSGEMKTDSLISLNTVREGMSAMTTSGPTPGDRSSLRWRKLVVFFFKSFQDFI